MIEEIMKLFNKMDEGQKFWVGLFGSAMIFPAAAYIVFIDTELFYKLDITKVLLLATTANFLAIVSLTIVMSICYIILFYSSVFRIKHITNKKGKNKNVKDITNVQKDTTLEQRYKNTWNWMIPPSISAFSYIVMAIILIVLMKEEINYSIYYVYSIYNKYFLCLCGVSAIMLYMLEQLIYKDVMIEGNS